MQHQAVQLRGRRGALVGRDDPVDPSARSSGTVVAAERTAERMSLDCQEAYVRASCRKYSPYSAQVRSGSSDTCSSGVSAAGIMQKPSVPNSARSSW